jgi:hypothetical protein
MLIKPCNSWEHDTYWEQQKSLVSMNRERSDWAKTNPNHMHRKAMATQAQQLLAGKTTWAPTWQNFAEDWRVRYGSRDEQQPSQYSPPPPSAS